MLSTSKPNLKLPFSGQVVEINGYVLARSGNRYARDYFHRSMLRQIKQIGGKWKFYGPLKDKVSGPEIMETMQVEI